MACPATCECWECGAKMPAEAFRYMVIDAPDAFHTIPLSEKFRSWLGPRYADIDNAESMGALMLQKLAPTPGNYMCSKDMPPKFRLPATKAAIDAMCPHIRSIFDVPPSNRAHAAPAATPRFFKRVLLALGPADGERSFNFVIWIEVDAAAYQRCIEAADTDEVGLEFTGTLANELPPGIPDGPYRGASVSCRVLEDHKPVVLSTSSPALANLMLEGISKDQIAAMFRERAV